MALPNLTQQPISQTYRGLLHTSNTPIKDNTLTPIYDGEGNPSAMRLGGENNDVEFTGKVIASDFKIRKSNGTFSLINYLYPVGSIYISSDNTNPQSRFEGTEWAIASEGRFLVGVGTNTDNNGYTANYTSGNNSGFNKVKLTISNLPSHSHDNINLVMNSDNDDDGSSPNAPNSVSIPSSAGTSPKTTVSSLLTPRDNKVLAEYGFTNIMSTNLINNNEPNSNTNVALLERVKDFGMSFSGVSIIEDVGEGVAFDNRPPSYGVYVWRRTV